MAPDRQLRLTPFADLQIPNIKWCEDHRRSFRVEKLTRNHASGACVIAFEMLRNSFSDKL
ncbi:hypothetical protein Pla22_29230 [Rubripirellula amarantea]|uniref:Uncharacterized protein n=1 Tax=Rubripirellula amarantea TaxID=2527999 RepID=A0A5C5WK01_9BACT|nr:hypothetical protein Pla22_29230 [Rubripirellula amarantea]